MKDNKMTLYIGVGIVSALAFAVGGPLGLIVLGIAFFAVGAKTNKK